MSLVEKALNKMKEAARRGALESAATVPAGSDAAASTASEPTHDTSIIASSSAVLAGPAATLAQQPASPPPRVVPPRKMLPADVDVLRAKGYLPPQEQENELVEQYRHIKRPLVGRAMTLKDGPLGRRASVILVTSALPGEGKTFTAINLARSLLTEQDATVLLIDADVASPQTTLVFGADGEKGLIDALLDPTLDPNSLILDTRLGVQFLAVGRHTELGSELFSSQRMAALIEQLLDAEPHRLIVLDSAPILVTNEGKTLAQLPGQVVLVVQADSTPQQAVLEAADLFEENQFVGVVLNQSDEAVGGGHYYGSYGYAGRYEYGRKYADGTAG